MSWLPLVVISVWTTPLLLLDLLGWVKDDCISGCPCIASISVLTFWGNAVQFFLTGLRSAKPNSILVGSLGSNSPRISLRNIILTPIFLQNSCLQTCYSGRILVNCRQINVNKGWRFVENIRHFPIFSGCVQTSWIVRRVCIDVVSYFWTISTCRVFAPKNVSCHIWAPLS